MYYRPETESTYALIEQALRYYLIPTVTGWKQVTDAGRRVLALPVREGGMAIEDPSLTADENYKASVNATLVMQRFIISRQKMQTEHFIQHNKHMGKCANDAKRMRGERYEKEAKQLSKPSGGLEGGMREGMKRAREYKTGAWLTVRPLEADHMRLTNYQWLDMVSLRYDKPLLHAQAYCDYHRNTRYDLRHAATCGGGGNRIHRHRTIQNCLQAIGH